VSVALFGCLSDEAREAPFRARLLRHGSPPEILARGALVVDGDELFLRLEVGRPIHVYAVNEDQYGRRLIIFPCRPSGSGSRLEPGEDRRLPSPMFGHEAFWPVRTPTARETILVLAGPSPIDPLDDAVAASQGEPCAALPTAAATRFIDLAVRNARSPAVDGKHDEILPERVQAASGVAEGVWLAVHEVAGG
jgi:hypothetical protein